jgi:2-hydroxycyclohexanecarboxyl-CoA dehydrogenase
MTDLSRRAVARTAVITGAGSRRGIGRATAHALATRGWHIAALDIDGPSAEDTAAEVTAAHGVQALGVACDITRDDQVDSAVSTVESSLPAVGAVVNNAGVSSPTRFVEVTHEEWDRIFEINVRGAFLVTHRVVPGLVERGFGRVVFLSSVSAQRGGGLFGAVPYSASKAALLGFARALAREVSHAGVTVNAVAPGLIDTDIFAGRMDQARRDELAAGTLVGRVGTVTDVADVIAFLCRDESSYLTGHTYDVNGGSHVH